jgi:hypothetical protein
MTRMTFACAVYSKIPPVASRPAGGTHTFSAAILPMPVSPPWSESSLDIIDKE